MKYLADTNIYLRLVNKNDPLCASVSSTITTLLQGGDSLCITAQSIYEFWAVATRSISANGLGWNTEQTRDVIDWLTTEFELLLDSPDVY
jgi:predicted nucleic-acid-binding protein